MMKLSWCVQSSVFALWVRINDGFMQILPFHAGIAVQQSAVTHLSFISVSLLLYFQCVLYTTYFSTPTPMPPQQQHRPMSINLGRGTKKGNLGNGRDF